MVRFLHGFRLPEPQGVDLLVLCAIPIFRLESWNMTNTNFRRTLVGAAVATTLGVLADAGHRRALPRYFRPDRFRGRVHHQRQPACLLDEWLACERGHLRGDAAQRLRGRRFLESRADLHRPTDVCATLHIELVASVRNLRLWRPDRLVRHDADSPASARCARRRTTGGSSSARGMPVMEAHVTAAPCLYLTVLPKAF